MNEKLLLLKDMFIAPRAAYARLREKPDLDVSLTLLLMMAVLISAGMISLNFTFTILNVVLTLILAMVSLTIGSILLGFLYDWVSRLFTKGDHANELRRAIPYSYLPLIIGTAIELSFPNVSGMLVVTSIAAGWSLVILTILISEIKGISIVQSFIVLISATLLMLSPVIAVFAFKLMVQ